VGAAVLDDDSDFVPSTFAVVVDIDPLVDSCFIPASPRAYLPWLPRHPTDSSALAVHIHDSGTENILSLASILTCGWDVSFKGGPDSSAALVTAAASHPLRRASGGCYYLDLIADPATTGHVRLIHPDAYSPSLHTAFLIDSGAQISLCTRGASLLLSDPDEPFPPTQIQGINGSSRTSGGGFLHLSTLGTHGPANRGRAAVYHHPAPDPATTTPPTTAPHVYRASVVPATAFPPLRTPEQVCERFGTTAAGALNRFPKQLGIAGVLPYKSVDPTHDYSHGIHGRATGRAPPVRHHLNELSASIREHTVPGTVWWMDLSPSVR
jgi:hypothetical protein